MILTRENPYPIFRVEDASWQGHIAFPILSEAFTIDDYSFHYEATSLDSPPTIQVLNIESGEKAEFAMQFHRFSSIWDEPDEGLPFVLEWFDPDLEEGKPVQDPRAHFSFCLENARRFQNLDLFSDVVSLKSDFNREVYLGEHADIIDCIGTPKLYWTNHGYTEGASSGWALFLNGAGAFEEVELAFALADDREGLKQLLEMMRDPRELSIKLALINSDQGRVLAARKTLEDLRLNQAVPCLTLSQWQARLVEAGLGALTFEAFEELSKTDPWADAMIEGLGTISPIQVEVGNNIIPIGLRVFLPELPAILLTEEPELATKSVDEIVAWMEAHKVETTRAWALWPQRFNELVRELGYRTVDVPKYSKADYWITDLSKEQWGIIESNIFEDREDADGHELLDERICF